MIKKFSDLRINDQIYVIFEDGELLTDHVQSIRKDGISGEGVHVNISDSQVRQFGSVSISITNKDFIKLSDKKFSVNIIVCSDYKVALRESIIKTRMYIDKYMTQLKTLTDNLTKNTEYGNL